MKTRRNTSHFSSSYRYVEIGWDGCVEDWTQLRSLGATASTWYAWHKHHTSQEHRAGWNTKKYWLYCQKYIDFYTCNELRPHTHTHMLVRVKISY